MRIPYLLQLGERIQSGLQRLPPELRQRHRVFLLSRQLPEGGFSGREVDLQGAPLFEDGAQPDLYYTSFAVRGLAALGDFPEAPAQTLAIWLKPMAARAVSVIDVLSWLYSALVVQTVLGTDLLTEVAPDWADRLSLHLESLRAPEGGYTKSAATRMGSTYHTFLAALCYELMGRELPNSDQLLEFVRSRQRSDGGFVEMESMKRSGTNPTAAAIALLKIFDALTSDICDRTASFLEEVRSDDGGIQANTRIPFSDMLSTFTGYLTSLDIGHPELLPERRLRRFLQDLEIPTGGFLAAGWDRAPDVEYTFYALGTLGLLSSQSSPPTPRTSPH